MVSFAPLDADAVDFLSEETGVDFRLVDFGQPKWFCASARNDHGAVVGVVTAEFKSWFDADLSVAIADPSCLSVKAIHAFFVAVFSTAKRVTAKIDPTNRRALDQAFKLGFEVEGYMRFGLDGHRDAYVLGMVKDTCRWLKPLPRRPLARQTGISEVVNGQRS